MQLTLSRIILYVQNVPALATFYTQHLGMCLTEEITNEWAVLRAGNMELALHRAGAEYRANKFPGEGSNAKLVFQLEAGMDLSTLRHKLIDAGISMRDIKQYAGFNYLLCDGIDPEGNVFQLIQLLNPAE